MGSGAPPAHADAGDYHVLPKVAVDWGLGLAAVSQFVRAQRRVAGELVREGKSPPLNLSQQGAAAAADPVGPGARDWRLWGMKSGSRRQG
jgi:hypothetical protein